MFVSGFTFCRNLEKLDYPFIESIKSLLPIVNEFVIAVGDSDDNTLNMIREIKDKKIKIINTVWDKNLSKDGLNYSAQTNIALSHCNENADWAFYLQGDEVIHEREYEEILASLRRHKDDKKILGLMMKYIHFKGDYFSVDLYQYRRAVRVVRPGGLVRSVGDAYGFARASDGQFLSKKTGELIRNVNGHIYHYGWVKTLQSKKEKHLVGIDWYNSGQKSLLDLKLLADKELVPKEYDILKEFNGTHPAVMESRVKNFPRLAPRKSRWLNLKMYYHILRHGFKG